MQHSSFAELLAGGDRRHRGQAESAVTAVMREPARFGELFALLMAPDAAVAARAAFAVETITRSRPDLLVAHRHELLDTAAFVEQLEVRRCVAMIVPRVKLDAKDRARALRLLDHWLDIERPPVVSAAMTSLADYAVEDAAVRAKVMPKFEALAKSRDTTMAARAAKVIAFLTRRAPATAVSPAKRPDRFSK